MTNVFGGFSSNITIFQDQENAGPRRVKALEHKNVPKRSALGNISNITRNQPARAAKQDKLKAANDFTIYSDENSKGLLVQKNILCENAKPSLQISTKLDNSKHAERKVLRPRAPLAPIEVVNEIESSPCDSPMVLDTSICEGKTLESPDERFDRLLSVTEYKEDVYTYLREAELKHRPKPGYMKKQPDITASMRTILVDWLVEVAEEYKLHRETLMLSVNYIDRFLSQMSVQRGKLQLVGAASMFLAAKYEEIYPPDVGEFVFITDDTYTKKQILRMEHLILKVLSFDVAVPTMNLFCDLYLSDIEADDTTRYLAMYLCELTLLEAEPFLTFVPSVIAAAAISLSNIVQSKPAWNAEAVSATKYQYYDIFPCLQELHNIHCRAPTMGQQAIREKYKLGKLNKVSSLVPPPAVPNPS